MAIEKQKFPEFLFVLTLKLTKVSVAKAFAARIYYKSSFRKYRLLGIVVVLLAVTPNQQCVWMKRARRALSRDTAYLLIALDIFCYYNHTINHTIEAYQIFNQNRIGIFSTLTPTHTKQEQIELHSMWKTFKTKWTLVVAFVFTYTWLKCLLVLCTDYVHYKW